MMYLLNNKIIFAKKIIRRKKHVAKHELIVLNAFSERVKILRVLFTKNTVNIRRPILGPFKSGRLGQMVTL